MGVIQLKRKVLCFEDHHEMEPVYLPYQVRIYSAYFWYRDGLFVYKTQNTLVMFETANTEYKQFDSLSFLQSFFHPNNKQTHKEAEILLKAINELPEKIDTVLNIGSGPTVHVELALRNRANLLFMSDYSEKNNNTVVNWITGKPDYDWDWMCEILNSYEKSTETIGEMQRRAREKIQAIDVFQQPLIRSIYWKNHDDTEIPKQFQLVISTFCITNISETREGFKIALKNSLDLVESGGYLVLAGNLKEQSYQVGEQKYEHEPLELDYVLMALKEFKMPAFAVFTDGSLFTSVSRNT